MTIRIMALHTKVENIVKLRFCRENKTIHDALNCSRLTIADCLTVTIDGWKRTNH